MVEDRYLWQERGWQRQVEDKMEVYSGKYRVQDREKKEHIFDGYVISHPPRSYQIGGVTMQHIPDIEVYIDNLTAEIRQHPHGSCFMLVGGSESNLHRLHFISPPNDVDTAILYMEQLLEEAFNSGH